MNNLLKVIITILIIGLFITACGSREEDLSEIDKEIARLQEELQNTEKDLEDKDDGSEESAETVKEEIEPSEITGLSSETKLEVMETEKVQLRISSTDEDNDKIIYTFSSPLNANGEWQTNYGDAGEYKIIVTASDGKLESKKDILLIVKKKNEAPSIEKIEDLIATEGDKVQISPKVNDVNKDELIVTISDPIGDDGLWETDHKSAGSYKVTITASDGEKQTTSNFNLRINDKNVVPVIEAIDDLTVNEGETIKLNPIVSDLDGDRVTIKISDPLGDDGEWKTGYSDNGQYKITVAASDGKSSATEEFLLTVKDVNRPPQILDIGLQ